MTVKKALKIFAFLVAINNYFIISVTDMVNHVNSLFSDKTVSYMNNKRYDFGLNKKNK